MYFGIITVYEGNTIFTSIFFYFWVLVIQASVSLYIIGCPGTCSVLRDMPASTSPMLGLKVCCTIPVLEEGVELAFHR